MRLTLPCVCLLPMLQYQMMYEVEEEPPTGPTYKTLDVDPSLFTRHYQQQSFKQSLKVIHPSFNNFKILERIDVSNQLLGDTGVESLCTAIQGAPVQVLNLSGNQITDVGIRHLVGILRSLHKLTCLNLSWNAFGDLGISLLTDRNLYHSGTVTQYDLTYNTFSPLAGYHLGNLFLGDSQGFCPVSHLRLGGNVNHRSPAWGDDFLKQFLSPFLKSPNIHRLKVLFLTDCSLTDVGLECLAGLLLCDKCALEELSLSKCFFTPKAKELLQRTFVLTHKRFQLFAYDCGVPVAELQYWQQSLINVSVEQKQRLQRSLVRYDQALTCIATTQQALLSCHVAQYYLRQQMLNSWNIEAPARWQVNPMVYERNRMVHNLAEETGVALPTDPATAAPPNSSPDGPSSPGSAGVLRKQFSSRLAGPATSTSSSLLPIRPSSATGSGSGKGGGTSTSTATTPGPPVALSASVSTSALPTSLPVLQRGPSVVPPLSRTQSQQLVFTNAASAKTHNAFNTATFVDTELVRQITAQRNPVCRMLAQQLVALMEQSMFVHFLQEVLAFLNSQSFNQQEVPPVELVPALAQAARSELSYLFTDVKRLEALHILRLPRWNAAVDAILLEGKDFLRRIEQEQNEALASTAALSSKSRSQRFPSTDATNNATTPTPTTNSPSATAKPFSRRSQQAAVRIVKVHNDERMERLFMMEEDAWAHTIELDRVDSTLIGDKYHFRLLHYAMVQISSAVMAQLQQQQQLNSSRLHGRSLNRGGRGSAQSLRSLTLSQHTQQEGQNASFVSNKSGASTPVLPAIGSATGGVATTTATGTTTTSSAVAAAMLTSTSAAATTNHNASFTFSDGLTSARSDTSATSSTKQSKKLQRQAVAAERAAQQQWQLIIQEGQEYHRNLIRKAVPCATTLGPLGFFLYYLHTVYSKEVEASAAKPSAV